VKTYFHNILIGLDQFANVVLGGTPDTTLSSRCWHHREHWAGALAVRFLNWLFRWKEIGHCEKSYEAEEAH